MTLEELIRRFDEMGRQLDRLPETEEPPPTTLQLFSRSRQEGECQRLLAYFRRIDRTVDGSLRVEQNVVGRADVAFEGWALSLGRSGCVRTWHQNAASTY